MSIKRSGKSFNFRWLLAMVLMFVFPKVGLSESNGQIFISNKFGSGIIILNENDLQTIKSIPPETASAKMMASTANRIVFVEFGTLTFYDNSLNKIADYDFFANPVPGLCKAVISPDGSKLYVGVIGWGKAEMTGIFVVDLKSGKTLREFKNPSMHSGYIEVSKDGKYVMVPERLNVIHVRQAADLSSFRKINLVDGDDIVEIQDVGSNAIITIVKPGPGVKNEEKPKHNRLDKINIQTGSRQSLGLPSESFRVLASGPRTSFVLGNKTLSEVDINQLTLVNTYTVEGDNIAISTDGKKIFVLDSMSNQLSVWDIARKEIVRTISVGSEPYEIMVR